MGENLINQKPALQSPSGKRPAPPGRLISFLNVCLCATLIVAALGLAACSSGSGAGDDFNEAAGNESGDAKASTGSKPVTLTPAQKHALESLLSQGSTSPELAREVQVILAVAGGMDNAEVSRRFGKDAEKVDLKKLLDQLE